jgi:uncharacterized membrane protein YgcG
MSIHILYKGKNLCGRSRIFRQSVEFHERAKSDCQECLKKHSAVLATTSKPSTSSSSGSMPVPTSSYDPIFDPLNPISPLNPFSPIHHSDPPPTREHAPAEDTTPHHDPAPSHDHSHSHDSGGHSSYDSGSSSYDSGSSSSDSGGGGCDGGGGGGGD